MPRQILEESKIHPAIRKRVARHHESIVEEAQDVLATRRVVVLGMRQNPVVRKARRALAAAGIPLHFIEHGSYLSEWRRPSACATSCNGMPISMARPCVGSCAR